MSQLPSTSIFLSNDRTRKHHNTQLPARTRSSNDKPKALSSELLLVVRVSLFYKCTQVRYQSWLNSLYTSASYHSAYSRASLKKRSSSFTQISTVAATTVILHTLSVKVSLELLARLQLILCESREEQGKRPSQWKMSTQLIQEMYMAIHYSCQQAVLCLIMCNTYIIINSTVVIIK